jgi:alpha-glucosidase
VSRLPDARSALPLALLMALALAASPRAERPDLSVVSPDGRVSLTVGGASDGPLTWSAAIDRMPVIERSALGIVVDGTNLGEGSEAVGRTLRYELNKRYDRLGVHARAVDQANGIRLSFRHKGTARVFNVEARAANDYVAFRILVSGTGRQVPDAAVAFTIPQGATIWSHVLRNHYEDQYTRRQIEEMPPGEWAGPPVTFQLKNKGVYASITEADLRHYPGMALQANGGNVLLERLGHSHPPSYPYVLRYKEDNAARLAVPAAIEGPITTPWRVVMIARDLNTLVNSDAVHNLAAPPDPALFPEGAKTTWIKPGRAVWRYLDGGDNSFEGIKEFSRLAGELGFEYQVVEGLWQKWTDEQLKELVEYSRARNVGIILWRHSNTLHDAAARRALFAKLAAAGVAGLKIDFFDHEALEVIDLYQAILKDAADARLLVNFHGANKPAGESRTWPNEVTREGIYGLEHRTAKAWATFNATMPFVRMLAGHADYTPVVFGERRKETSWAHQIATAVILTSPLLVYGGHPASLLSNPAADVIKSIPSVWDETRVLPPSEIGELALFARRRGDSWFVAALNGPAARTVTIDPEFLSGGAYKATIVRDKMDNDAAVEIESLSARRGQPLRIAMRGAGGFVVRFSKPGP